MDDVIYRQAAIRWVKTECNPYGKPTIDFESDKKVIEHLEQMPSAERKIVRCKDCLYLFDGEHNANCCALLMRKAKWITEITVDMNWYCADGERRTDDCI